MRPTTATTVLVAVAFVLAGACSSDPEPPVAVTGTRPPTTSPATTPGTALGPGPADTSPSAPEAPAGPTPPAAPGDTPVTGGPEVVTFHLPGQVPCTGAEVAVTATYTTVGATQVAFVVDQEPVRGGPNPPVSGDAELTLPCDGNAHTVLLVAVGPTGQALASRAVRTGEAPGGDG
jgi:hypothetical protein